MKLLGVVLVLAPLVGSLLAAATVEDCIRLLGSSDEKTTGKVDKDQLDECQKISNALFVQSAIESLEMGMRFTWIYEHIAGKFGWDGNSQKCKNWDLTPSLLLGLGWQSSEGVETPIPTPRPCSFTSPCHY